MKNEQLKRLLLASGWVVKAGTSEVFGKICETAAGERECQIILLRSFCKFQFRSLHAEWFTLGQSYYKDLRLHENIVVIGTVKVQVNINE